jgi:zinc and cadmium transporter
MGIALLLAVYCALIMLASMLGGWLPKLVRLTHLRTQLLISFVAGLMLSIATVQLLPHSIEQLGSASWTGMAVLLGILAMFIMLRAFHVHPHATSPLSVLPDSPVAAESSGRLPADGESHGRKGLALPVIQEPVSAHGNGKNRSMSWVALLFGLGIHSLMDGIALSSSVAADWGHGAWMGLFGLGTFLAICLHKPLDAFAITSTMQASGWSNKHCQWINIAFSVLSPLGAILFWVGANRFGMSGSVIGLGLALSAGFFICIALADLLPEVHFHSHDRVALTATLLLGVSLAIAIENLPGHEHTHDAEGREGAALQHSHEGEQHNHDHSDDHPHSHDHDHPGSSSSERDDHREEGVPGGSTVSPAH